MLRDFSTIYLPAFLDQVIRWTRKEHNLYLNPQTGTDALLSSKSLPVRLGRLGILYHSTFSSGFVHIPRFANSYTVLLPHKIDILFSGKCVVLQCRELCLPFPFLILRFAFQIRVTAYTFSLTFFLFCSFTSEFPIFSCYFSLFFW